MRGWYSVCAPADDRDAHRLRTIALIRSFDGRVCPSHHSLLVLHGLPTFKADLKTIHVCRLADAWSRHRTGAVIHPSLGGKVTLPQAIVQTGQVNGAMDSLIAADAALHRSLVTTAELLEAMERFRGHRHTAQVRRILPRADGRCESPGETRTRLLMIDHGFDVIQVTIPDGPVSWRVDFLIEGTNVIVEFDGMVKYGDNADLVQEKRREDRLRALGYEVVRITWSDLSRPDRVIADINRALARGYRAA